MMKLYCSKLKQTKNLSTGKTYYYVKKCDYFTRISKTEYKERESYATRSDSFLTECIGNFIYQYKTIYFNI